MIQNSTQFIDLFNLPCAEYYDPLALTDIKFGFSVKRNYPIKNFEFRPPIDESGNPIEVAVMWVALIKDFTTSNKGMLVTVRIATWRKSQPEEEVEEKLVIVGKNKKPLALEYTNDFYYHPNENSFSDQNGTIIAPIEILNKVFEQHCRTIHPFYSLELKFKLFVLKIADLIFLGIVHSNVFLIQKVFRRKLEFHDSINLPLSDTFFEFKKIEEIETAKLDFWGWKADKVSIIIFSFIVCLLSIASYLEFIKIGYWEYIKTSPLIIAAHVIFALLLIEKAPHPFLFNMTNMLLKIRRKFLFTRIDPFTIKNKLSKYGYAIIVFGILLQLLVMKFLSLLN